MTTGPTFTDASSGTIGPKTFGHGGKTVNYGDVLIDIDQTERDSLAGELEELRQLVRELKHPNPEERDSVATDLGDLGDEVNSETPDSERIESLWTRCKRWIDSAIGVSLFATDKAETVKGMVGRIAAVLG